jgi:oxygen-independent coproporphyrinogen III oxidase
MLHEAVSWLDNRHEVDTVVDSVYFGGGTPSILSLDDVASTLSPLRARHTLAPDVEICFEANPEDVSVEYLRGLADLGVTRLSLGVQTLSDESLRIIGRSGRDHVLRAYDAFIAADTGMILSTDFIAGLPATRTDTVAGDIRETLSRVDARHSSVYMLESGRYPPEYDFPE